MNECFSAEESTKFPTRDHDRDRVKKGRIEKKQLCYIIYVSSKNLSDPKSHKRNSK